MGYELHITRAEEHFSNEGREITADEWLRYVESDPELTRIPTSKYMVSWSGKSKYPDPWFDWCLGNISTKHPDRPMVAKMIEMATHFGARVQGDDCEIYEDVSQVPE
jgi:hypothetical protein